MLNQAEKSLANLLSIISFHMSRSRWSEYETTCADLMKIVDRMRTDQDFCDEVLLAANEVIDGNQKIGE